MDRPTAKDLALKWLAASDKTEAELRARLEKRGFSDVEIAAVIQDLAARHWLDDQRVLDRDVESAAARPDIGRGMVRQKLLRRGLNEDLVDAHLNSWTEEGEAAKAAALLDSKLRPGDPPARAARLLSARGFSEDVIRSALEHRFPDWPS